MSVFGYMRSLTDDTDCMPPCVICVVASVNKVSEGGVLWKTTPAIEDFPALFAVSDIRIGFTQKSRTACLPSG